MFTFHSGQAGRQAGRLAGRQIGRQVGRQAVRQTDRQAGRKAEEMQYQYECITTSTSFLQDNGRKSGTNRAVDGSTYPG